MSRPKIGRIIKSNPNCKYFKPQGIPMFNLEEVIIDFDHYEALKLANLKGLSMKDGATKMGISASTFNRILKEANKIIADAIINGKCIKICKL